MDSVSALGSQCLLMLPPSPRDGAAATEILQQYGIVSQICDDLADMCETASKGAGAALIAEEHLLRDTGGCISQLLRQQPVWSDLPLIVLMISGDQSSGSLQALQKLGNVSLLMRPLKVATFVSTVEGALRDRARQYAVRDLLQQRDKVKRDIAASERRLRMALKAGGMAAWEWTQQESIWTDGVYELLGLAPETQASQELFFSCIHPQDLAGVEEAWRRTIAGIEPYEHEFRIVRPDGSVRWLVGVGETVRDNAGHVVRLFGLNWDNTREHEAADALRESQQRAQQASIAKSEFVANMSHEIRTPMTAVLGYADLLAARESDAEKVEFLKAIKRNGNYLLEIINDILDLSKIEAGKMEILSERFAPQRVVADVISMMSIRAAEKELAFDVEFEGRIPAEIEGDPKRLRQILMNLVGNAIKFTEAGSVKLKARYLRSRKTPVLRFKVIDTGIGMTQQQQQRLFLPFSQGDPSVTRRFGGTGLGLAISLRLAKLLDGEIQVSSEPGVGSTFSLTVPVGDVTGVPLIRPASAPAFEEKLVDFSERRLDCRILAVDDSRDVRFLVEHLLSGAGANVQLAEDGEQALRAIAQSSDGAPPFDLVLLDIQMPGRDGYSTARQMRKRGFTAPIIALTADAMDGDRQHSLQAGCNAHLSKPIDARTLVDLVAQFAPHAASEPVKPKRSPPQRGTKPQPSVTAANGRKRILVVDDSVDAATVLQRLLQIEGYDVQVSHDGFSALEEARAFTPHVVLLDISLPGMDGYDTLSRLKSQNQSDGTRFFCVSGHTQPEDVRRALEAGFDCHIEKPVDIPTLLALLRQSV